MYKINILHFQFSVFFLLATNVPPLADCCGFWKEFFPLPKNEFKKLKVQSNEKVAIAVSGC